MALAHLADRDDEAPDVRFLVLREMYGVVSTWARVLDDELVGRVEEMTTAARNRTLARLRQDLDGDGRKADLMLDWFEKEFDGLDRGMDA